MASLKEIFDLNGLKPTHVPGGWVLVGGKGHAVQGHEFGLELELGERADLIAFLRTL